MTRRNAGIARKTTEMRIIRDENVFKLENKHMLKEYIKKLECIHNTSDNFPNIFRIVKIVPPRDWDGKENPTFIFDISKYENTTVWTPRDDVWELGDDFE